MNQYRTSVPKNKAAGHEIKPEVFTQGLKIMEGRSVVLCCGNESVGPGVGGKIFGNLPLRLEASKIVESPGMAYPTLDF